MKDHLIKNMNLEFKIFNINFKINLQFKFKKLILFNMILKSNFSYKLEYNYYHALLKFYQFLNRKETIKITKTI